MTSSRILLALSLVLVAAGCASPSSTEDSGASTAAESRGDDQAPQELAALDGMELVVLDRVPLPAATAGAVATTGIYINLETPIRLANGDSASFIECDLRIAKPYFVDSQTLGLDEGEAFTVAGVSNVAEVQSGARATFQIDATRTDGDETQGMAMTCAIGGMSPMAYLTTSSMLIRRGSN